MDNAPVTPKPQFGSIYKHGDVVFNMDHCNVEGNPTRKKLWVWDTYYELKYGVLVALKDGPGKDAKDLGWYKEKNLEPWCE